MNNIIKTYWTDDSPNGWFTKLDNPQVHPILEIKRYGKDKYALLVVSFEDRSVSFTIGKRFIKRLEQLNYDLCPTSAKK